MRTNLVALKFVMCEQLEMANGFTPSTFADAAGISKGFACDLLSRKRPASQAMAIQIYRKTGHKVRPIEGMSDEEISQLEALLLKAA